MGKPWRCVGMISGTSADGIDIALIETDGQRVIATGASGTYPYRPATRARILALAAATRVPDPAEADAVAEAVETDHQAALKAYAAEHGVDLDRLDLLGFHGQTVFHDAPHGVTVQLGDPARFAALVGLPVVGRFRDADMANGGEGAPIVPLYHAAIVADLTLPMAVLNIGGVSNATLVTSETVSAYDIGPGNAPLDDWVSRHTGQGYDQDGALAGAGTVDSDRVAKALAHPYFSRRGPRSLDRNDFTAAMVDGLGLEDGAATLVEITAAAIAHAAGDMAPAPTRWLVCGGGRRNPAMMAALSRALTAPVEPIETIGFDGDVIEAQAIAFLAVRSRLGLPLTVPSSTGCRTPTPGGQAFDRHGRPL